MIEARDRQANDAVRIAPASESPQVFFTTENLSASGPKPVPPPLREHLEIAPETTSSQDRIHQQPDSSKGTPPASDETQSWSPRIIRRGR